MQVTLTPEVESKISACNDDGHGQACRFYFVGPNHGLKLYSNERLRNNMYLCQRMFSKYGVCPKVYNKMDVGGKFGFVTALCDIGSTMLEEQNRIYPEHRQECTIWYYKHTKAFKEFEKSIKYLFPYLEINDKHDGNVGLNYETHAMNFVDVGHFRMDNTRGYDTKLEDFETQELIDTFFEHGIDLLEE